ncbi:RloB family protein [Chryseobacterium takakiae]|uniref:RloB-like protein n=1 Tax=Chryseobacterium takakiae TaxID=1302685 RepID=A0A1M4Y290_9FLAO|nr:RloB family protein [Chryseobacterium takakiae]SHE99871.1 RloB-like protein [Chryseobacterium takakiae]
MIHKKRGYKRETQKDLLRDYKLFAIACEGGKREPQYFRLFEFLSTRIKVDIIEEKVQDEELLQKFETKSAPKWVLDRAVKYIEQEGLIDEDELWFVMDVDRWTSKQLREMIDYCSDKPNWNIVLSNPCFEVWLFLHRKENFNNSKSIQCKEFKDEISNFDSEGYNPLNFITLIKDAVIHAKTLDSDPNNEIPLLKETKVYKLIESILKFVSKKQFTEFVNEKHPQLIRESLKKGNKNKIIKSKRNISQK